MQETSGGFGLNNLKGDDIELSTKAIEIFNEDARNQDISIQVSIAGSESFAVQFNVTDLKSPNKQVNNAIAATIESLLNQIPTILTVQNKL